MATTEAPFGFEAAWPGSLPSLEVSHNDIAAFMAQFSAGVTEEGTLVYDYEALAKCLENGGKDYAMEHDHAVMQAGLHATGDEGYSEADEEMFSWGYNFYTAVALETGKLSGLPQGLNLAAFAPGETAKSSVDKLVAVAEVSAQPACQAADKLLDGLVVAALYDPEEPTDDPSQELVAMQVRAEQLAVMLAGIGLAHKHCQEMLDSDLPLEFAG